MMEKENESRLVKIKPKPTGPSFKRQYKDDSQPYKYVEPVKEFPAKYKETRIKIWEVRLLYFQLGNEMPHLKAPIAHMDITNNIVALDAEEPLNGFANDRRA